MAIAAAERARARGEAAEAALAEAVRLRCTEERATGSSALELEARCRWLTRLREGERLLRDEVERRVGLAERADAELERRRLGVVEADRQVRTVERHRGIWERARLRVARAAEEAEQDDRSSAAQRRT